MALEREASPPPGAVAWLRAHAVGLAGCAVGLAAVAVASVLYFGGGGDTPRIPDVRFTAPFLVVTLALAIAAMVRREGVWLLPVSGVALAAIAMVLGWAVVVAVIVAVTALIIAILHHMM